MKFQEALKLMQEGKKVKLPSWGGYWYWDEEKKTVMIRCKDDTLLDIRETQVVEYTLLNVASDEWTLADEDNTPILGGTATYNFGEAIKYLKRGIKVARKGWNGKGMWVEKTDLRINNVSLTFIDNPCLILRNVQGTFNTWIPSITDLFAEDWVFVD